jgi:hypothetical protein
MAFRSPPAGATGSSVPIDGTGRKNQSTNNGEY